MDKVVHFEISSDDFERAGKFYGDVFGWATIPVPQMSYTVVHTGPTDQDNMVQEPGFINGGIFKRSGQRTNPVIVIQVDSIDDSVKKIEAHGGKIVEPKMQVGDMGYVAYFTDTEGNLLGIWENIPSA